MKNRGDTYTDRLETQAKARQALLEKARQKDPTNDPEFAARQQARIEAAKVREERELGLGRLGGDAAHLGDRPASAADAFGFERGGLGGNSRLLGLARGLGLALGALLLALFFLGDAAFELALLAHLGRLDARLLAGSEFRIVRRILLA
ncbi:MAG TPA: DUF6481 family protein, partial [Reyranella sp.]|nr:DUF6481 family protein [Reyranella sp.]